VARQAALNKGDLFVADQRRRGSLGITVSLT
jgi:hypothetical protein